MTKRRFDAHSNIPVGQSRHTQICYRDVLFVYEDNAAENRYCIMQFQRERIIYSTWIIPA